VGEIVVDEEEAASKGGAVLPQQILYRKENIKFNYYIIPMCCLL